MNWPFVSDIYCDGGTIKTHYRHCPSGPLFAIQKNRKENFYLLLVGILRGLTVQVSDERMEIGIHDNLITLISNHSRPTLGFAHEGFNLQSKIAAIEILKFAYNFKSSACKSTRNALPDIFKANKFIYGIGDNLEI